MSHSDDKGLVLPPAIAPLHVVIVPFFKTDEDLEKIQEYLRGFLYDLEFASLVIHTETLFGSSKTRSREIVCKLDIDTEKSP